MGSLLMELLQMGKYKNSQCFTMWIKAF